jgi:High potential iron-sulfur protein
MSLSRRTFIENSGIMMIASAGISSVAWPAPSPGVVGIGSDRSLARIQSDASSVDKGKFPQYAAGQSCAGCALYQGTAAIAITRWPSSPSKD